jgi:uncharacterized protein (DUF983 family)
MKEDIRHIDRPCYYCDTEGFLAGGVARGGNGSDGTLWKGKRNDRPGVSGLYPDRNGQDERFSSDDNGLAAFCISVVCGLILTYILIYAINYRSFGWSVDVHVNPWVFVKTLLLTAGASLASALYPTYKLTRTAVVGALHEE